MSQHGSQSSGERPAHSQGTAYGPGANSGQAEGPLQPARILLVEDDPLVGSEVARRLQRDAGFQVSLEPSGLRAIERVLTEVPDLVLLDLGLPDVDGLVVLKKAKQFYKGPVIILSARSKLECQVQGLDLGAEDYVTKPFEMRYLLALVRRKLETWHSLRQQPAAFLPAIAPGPYVVGPLVVDPVSRQATLRAEQLNLTETEFDLLAILARQPGVVISKVELLDMLRACGCVLKARPVDMLVSRLRTKLGDSGRRQEWIRTTYGKGICLRTRVG